MSKKNQVSLAGIIGESHRQIIHAVVDEIQASPKEEYALQLMPIVNVPAAILFNERLSGAGGLTGERSLGEKGKAISNGSSQMRPFVPGAYQEHALFTEKELLMLRKLGSIGERGATGLTSGELDHMTRSGNKLKLRIKNRVNKLIWDALFLGKYNHKGSDFSFDVPAGNTIAAATDWSVAATATPLKDLYTLQTTNVKIIKYVVKEWVMNPKTAADMLNSDEVRKVLINHAGAVGDINKVASILYPGLAPIKIVKDNYQDESLAADGQIVLGAVQFFVPDDKVLMVPDLSGTLYGMFGEFDMTENLNDPSATLDVPATGIYTFVSEKGLEDRESPHVKIVSGFNGAPNLLRPNDVFQITV